MRQELQIMLHSNLIQQDLPVKRFEIQTLKNYQFQSLSCKALGNLTFRSTLSFERSPVKNCPGHPLSLKNNLMKNHHGSFFNSDDQIRSPWKDKKGPYAFFVFLFFLKLKLPFSIFSSFN